MPEIPIAVLLLSNGDHHDRRTSVSISALDDSYYAHVLFIIAGLFSELSLYLNWIFESNLYMFSKGRLIIFHSTVTLIRVISNTPRVTHNDPPNLYILLSNLSPNISHLHLLDDGITLPEHNAMHPASTTVLVLLLSRNVEEPQLRSRQILKYLKLWARFSELEVDPMTGDLDIILHHPSHISKRISNVSLLRLRLQVCF